MVEILYLLFILSGRLKLYLKLFDISLPVDITVLFAGLIVLALVSFRSKTINKSSLISLLFLLLFQLWMAITLLYSPKQDYAITKTVYFLLNILAFVFPILISNFRVKLFLKQLTISSLVLGLANVVLIIGNAIGIIPWAVLKIAHGEYLHSGLYLGLTFLIIWTYRFKLFASDRTNYILAVLSLVLLLLTGARGPFIFTIITALLYSLLTSRKLLSIPRYIKKSSFVGIIAGLVLLVTFSKRLFSRLFARFVILFESLFQKGHEVNPRTLYLERGFKYIFSHIDTFFIGEGVASFGAVLFNDFGRFYPHNIILEIVFELGIIGLALFLFFVIFALFGSYKQDPLKIAVLYLFLNCLKSYSLIDIRILFSLFGIIAICKGKSLLENKL